MRIFIYTEFPKYTFCIFSELEFETCTQKVLILNFLQVNATDLDSNENGQITYSIVRGDNHNQFTIDPNTGYISVADMLDRETVSSYVLEVVARDNGIPVLSGQVLVNIEISDANDNPPLFSQSNYTTIIQVR